MAMTVLQNLLSSKYAPRLVADDGVYGHHELVQTLWLAAAMLAVRWVAEKTVLVAMVKRLGNLHNAKGAFDNFYVAVFAVLSEALAVYVTLKLNGGCTPWSTDPCLTGWPDHPVHVLQKWYMIIMFHFYLHELAGAVVGLGPKLHVDVVVHHIATMSLIAVAYSINLSRYGVMWQALFDTSNPLLHVAKGLHSARVKSLERVKWIFFILMALTFFVCRVAMAPASILYPTLTRAFTVLPHLWAGLLLVLMAIVYGLQWMWFAKIVQLGKGGTAEGNNDGRGAKNTADKKKH